MKKKFCLMCLVLIVGCQSLTSPPPSRTAAERRTDRDIVSSIQGSIGAERIARTEAVHVSSYDGNVVLSGVVPDDAVAARLVAIAKSTPGVNKVTNNLTVSEPSAGAGAGGP